MNVTIIGIGNAGSTIGADLAHKGHDVKLLKASNSLLHYEHYQMILEKKFIQVHDLTKKYEGKFVAVTDKFQDAIPSADTIILFVQTNYHKEIIEQMIPYLHDGQTVILEPGYLSTSFFMSNKECPEITIIEAESSPIDCRITSPGEVKVLFKNVMNPFGVYPQKDRHKAEKVLEQLGYPYEITSSVVEAALHNPNIIVHTIGALMSIPRIEFTKGDYWMYREVFTPHVWNMVEALDKEKMDILEKLGCDRISYVEACKNRNSLNKNINAKEVFFDYAMNDSPSGPSIPDSRYLTEDVSQGLVMLESIGQVLKVPTPTTTSIIDLSSAALKRNFRYEGRTTKMLGFDNILSILKDSNCMHII